MTSPPGFREEVDIREEVDVVRVDPLFIERQRNRYAGRAVAYIVWLNGLAAIALLIGLLAHGALSAESAKRFADAMMVFGIGAAAGLTSALFGYLRRTASIERPDRVIERRAFAWLGIVAAIIGAGCFVGALTMGRAAVLPEATVKAPSGAPAAAPEAPAPGSPGAAPSAPETPPAGTPRP